jgi:AraC-like DNA-binding protein
VSSFEWLLKEALVDTAVPATPLFEADDENWRATIEQVELAPSLHVFLNEVAVHRDLRVESVSRLEDRYVVSQVPIEGAVDVEFPGGVHARASVSRGVLYRPVKRPTIFVFKAGGRFTSAGYTLDVDRIEHLFEGQVPSAFRPLLDRHPQQCHCLALRNDSAMRRLARLLFARGFNGPLRRLTMEGVILQLLAAQAMAAGESPKRLRDRPSSLSAREQAAVRRAREQLLSDMRRPPSLADLAKGVGLTERRLNAGFLQLYGATVFDVLRDQRLEHAREVLQANALSLKELSYRVGYNHVSSFVHAFRARYGAPPRQFSRRG